MVDLINREVIRDSLLSNPDYMYNYFASISGFPDIKIVDTGIRLLESKIELNYELNTELTEALSLLYSEHLYELEIDSESLNNNFSRLSNYIIEKGIRVDYRVNNNRTTFTNMVFEDDMFKNYLFPYSRNYRAYKKRLKSFKTKGAILVDKIKKEYNIL